MIHLIAHLRAYMLDRKRKELSRQFGRGYDYAAGQLLRFYGNKQVVRQLWIESEPDVSNPFCEGMRSALLRSEHMRNFKVPPHLNPPLP